MKTKKVHSRPFQWKLIVLISVIIIVVSAVISCSATKKSARSQTETTQAPSPLPPPSPPVIPLQRPSPGQKDGEAYVVVEEMPVFPGGDAALLKFIAENTTYPKEAKDKNIQGRVIVKFMINEDGTVSNATIMKGVNESLDNESLKVVSALPKFTPGRQSGVIVPVWYMVPITYTLAGDQQRVRFDVIGVDTVYSRPDISPSFTGGMDALNKFKAENVNYPQEIKNLGIEGMIFIRFIIKKDGSVSNVKIMNGISPELDKEAIRVTKLMTSWKPGTVKGEPVACHYLTNYEFLITPRTQVAPEEGTPYVVVEEMPMFPGGDSTLLAWIASNTKYPETAKNNGIQGRVIVRFCVTDVGGIDRVTVLKGVDPDLDNEALRVVSSLPKFKPGKQGGKPVNVWYMVPISFGLENKADPSSPKPPPPPPPPMPAGYDEPPFFQGGEAAIYKFIKSKIVYPKTAKEAQISGKVTLRFCIDTNGSVGEVSVIKGINPELDAEALRVIKLLPAWNPAKSDGEPVKIWYMLPVIFSLY